MKTRWAKKGESNIKDGRFANDLPSSYLKVVFFPVHFFPRVLVVCPRMPFVYGQFPEVTPIGSPQVLLLPAERCGNSGKY